MVPLCDRSPYSEGHDQYAFASSRTDFGVAIWRSKANPLGYQELGLGTVRSGTCQHWESPWRAPVAIYPRVHMTKRGVFSHAICEFVCEACIKGEHRYDCSVSQPISSDRASPHHSPWLSPPRPHSSTTVTTPCTVRSATWWSSRGALARTVEPRTKKHDVEDDVEYSSLESGGCGQNAWRNVLSTMSLYRI